MSDYTPRKWPEFAKPTAEEWLPWFEEQTPENRLELTRRLLALSDEGARCFTADHAALFHQLYQQQEALIHHIRLVSRYKNAWRSARRRAFIASVPDPLTRAALRGFDRLSRKAGR